MTTIFIDTNIFLHFLDINQINWLSVVHCKKCCLAISPIVIDELDKYKDCHNRKGKRAKNALKMIEKHLSDDITEIRPNVNLHIINNKPTSNTYEKYSLNFEEQDHRLFASILDYKEANPNDEIFICTNDIGPRIRAKQYKIKPLELEDKYTLKVEPDAKDIKIKELEKENLLYKNQCPKLDITFLDDKNTLSVDKNKEFTNKDIFIHEHISNEEVLHPVMLDESNISTQFGMRLVNPMAPSKEQRDIYNLKREKYLSEFKVYLETLYDYELLYKQSLNIKTLIKNSGTIPATCIDIHFILPKNLFIIEKKAFPVRPKKPSAPQKPSSLIDMKIDYGLRHSLFGVEVKHINYFEGIEKIDLKNSIDIHVDRLKHLYTKNLDEYLILFSSYEEIKSFDIKYIITADNLPVENGGYLKINNSTL